MATLDAAEVAASINDIEKAIATSRITKKARGFEIRSGLTRKLHPQR
jgi:hypothetical protein